MKTMLKNYLPVVVLIITLTDVYKALDIFYPVAL